MEDVDQRIIDYAKTCKNGEMTTKGFKASIDTMSLSAKAGKVALQALAMAGNMLIAWGVSKAIELVVKAFDNYIHRVENANEATKQAIETFESVTSEVESLENKITEINQEINGLDPITDAQDIENLRLENEELSTQLAILKEKQRVAGLEADKTAQDSLNMTQDSKYKFDTFTDSMGGVTVVASQVTKEEELLNAIEAYDTYKAKADEANKALADMAKTGNYTQKEWNAQEKAIERYSDGMLKARSHANELAIELNEQIQGLNGNTVASQALIDSVNASIAGYNEWIGSIDGATDALSEQANIQGEIADEPPISFNIAEHEKSIDDIQSSLTTLRSALDSFNQGTLDESAVLDLMQQFPSLIPYIDLAADGFGNLSEGLSVLIAQQPDALIQDLEQLKLSLNTDEERAQVDLLINSLQRLSSYGDTGMEAYATSIGSTWSDTANVIDSVTTQFENLAKIQEAVSDGLTMSATAAAELAKMYPEILTNCEIAANGQITLNEDVVKNILAGDQSIVDAQITKLEADKAVLEAKQKTAESELEIAKQVGTAKGQITEEEARNQIEALEAELQAELEKNRQTVESYAVATESKMQNASQFNTHAATVASDIATNMLSAAVSMANNMKVNSENSQQSLSGIGHKAAEVAKSIAAIATGQVVDTSDKIHGGKGGTNASPIKIVNNTKGSSSVTRNYLDGNIDLGEFQSQLELDIKGYTDAIANIDGQIAVLKNLQATFKDTVDSANGGIGSHGYADKIKELEDEKGKINDALDDAKSGSGSSTKEAEDNFEEMIDFFERRTDVLNNALTLLKTNLDNVTGAFAKNQLIDAELGITEEKFKNTADALNMYTQKANEALSKLPSDIAAKVKDGAVDLTTFIGEGNKDVVDAIKDYETWADRIASCKKELAELKTAIRQLTLQKFENIMQDYQNMFDLREDSKTLIEKQIALFEAAGQLIGESFYTVQIEQSKKQLQILEEEKTKLVNQFESAISSGKVKLYCPII